MLIRSQIVSVCKENSSLNNLKVFLMTLVKHFGISIVGFLKKKKQDKPQAFLIFLSSNDT